MTKERLSKKLKLNIIRIRVRNIDYVKDMVSLAITYELAADGTPLRAPDDYSELSGEYASNVDPTLSEEI